MPGEGLSVEDGGGGGDASIPGGGNAAHPILVTSIPWDPTLGIVSPSIPIERPSQ
jgi:hypothetical protein